MNGKKAQLQKKSKKKKKRKRNTTKHNHISYSLSGTLILCIILLGFQVKSVPKRKHRHGAILNLYLCSLER